MGAGRDGGGMEEGGREGGREMIGEREGGREREREREVDGPEPLSISQS